MKAIAVAVLCFVVLLSFSACGGGSAETRTTPPPPVISVTANPTTVAVSHDGTPVAVQVTVTTQNTTAPVTLSVTPATAGVTVDIQQPTSGSGKLTFKVTDAAAARATSYALTVQASNIDTRGTAPLTMNVMARTSVGATAGTTPAAFMSTSFQLASWSYDWLSKRPDSLKPLGDIGAHHIRIQALNSVAPETAPGVWDFTKMDAMVQPILAVGDQSPQLQIGNAPTYMYDSSGKFRDATFAEFAEYCANLVRYYNKGGFTVHNSQTGEDVTYRSPSGIPITWWGVYNEPNINNVTADEYVKMYNTVAAAMLAVDPSIKLVAIELSDWGSEPQKYLPPLLAGATQPIHAIGTHYYGTCNQKDTDQQLINAVGTFVDHVKYFRTTLDANAATNGVPIWVTENNVNADWSNNGVSACNPPQQFVSDPRGSSAFFAGWRPYVYSQLTSAGVEGLWHWSFPGDAQYGEYNDNGKLQLSYWVDYYLAHLFGDQASTLLPATVSEPSRVEVMAVQRADGSRVIMVANRDVAQSSDNNGKGVPKTVTLDLSALGNITKVSLIAIDASTNAATGPTVQSLSASQTLTLTFPGYGVQFVTVK